MFSGNSISLKVLKVESVDRLQRERQPLQQSSDWNQHFPWDDPRPRYKVEINVFPGSVGLPGCRGR